MSVVLLAAVAVILTWQVVTRSLASYLARAAPETALVLRPDDPTALLNLADAKLSESQAKGEAAQSGQQAAEAGSDASATNTRASDNLRLWAELASKTAQKRPDQPHSPEEPSGSTALTKALGLTEHTRELVVRWTERALVGDPLSARAVSILGQIAHGAADETAAAKFFRAAAQRSVRERVAVYWMMQKSHESRDYVAAIYHADTLLRTRSQASPYVMPFLVQMAESKEAAGELAKTLLANPPWRSNFLSLLAQSATDPRTTLELLLAIRKTSAPPTAGDLRNYVKALVGRKQHELAYYAWLEFLSPAELNSTGFLFNGSFELIPSGVPFDWVIGEGAGVTVDIAEHPDRYGQRALLIEFGYGRVQFPDVYQLTMLAPGPYRFKASYKGELLGKRGMVWRIACVDAPNTQIAESPMVTGVFPRWKEIDVAFAVPATDCRTQQVRLQLDARMASEQLVSGSMWYDDVRIMPADAIDRR